ncbi:MAG: acetyl-CoA carboxylase, carboxyltransferase subunit beta [Firmicutes bacterium]|nr:acetyl-CoA carboxylase, carboxyltransferase subunit beta [Bacillota bacterium]
MENKKTTDDQVKKDPPAEKAAAPDKKTGKTKAASEKDKTHSLPPRQEICPQCKTDLGENAFERNLKVCPSCNNHLRLSAKERIKLLIDPGTFREWEKGMTSVDPLRFVDKKTYMERLREAQEATGMIDAVIIGLGEIDGNEAVFCFLDFEFMGGTMGSVVGEKISAAFNKALKKKLPVISVVSSGGARMQEGILSLMQMAKTSAAVARFHKAGLPYISVQTNPTTGGISASFSSLGDVVIAEPKALIGFVGPRVVEQTIGEKLPPEASKAEFLLEHGMLDKIVERKDLKTKIAHLVAHFTRKPPSKFPRLSVPHHKPLKHIEAWDAVEAARNPGRPTSLDYIERIFTNFIELKGDRHFGDDPAVITGLGDLEGQTVAVIAMERGRNDDERKMRNRGMARPEGYRKAQRMMDFAEKFKFPLITFVDTPGAYPGYESLQRGMASALAHCFRRMVSLQIPTLTFVVGEGGSGGALALAVADRVFMQERAIFSVISPEGAASILYGDAGKAKELAPFMKLTAFDLYNLEITDKIVPESQGGAHTDILTSSQLIKIEMLKNLDVLRKVNINQLLDERYEKYEKMGKTGVYWQELLKHELKEGIANIQKSVTQFLKESREGKEKKDLPEAQQP